MSAELLITAEWRSERPLRPQSQCQDLRTGFVTRSRAHSPMLEMTIQAGGSLNRHGRNATIPTSANQSRQ